MKKIIVYGLGAFGKKVVNSIFSNKNNINIEIVALMDKEVEEYRGHVVKKPCELKELQYDFIVVTSKKWFEKIKAELVNGGVEAERIIPWTDLEELGEKRFCCNICDKEFVFGIEEGVESSAFTEHIIVGGGIRENAICPFCGSSDRERYIHWIMKTKTDIYEVGGRILHFAPEKGIENKLRRFPEYRTADIQSGADEIQDITAIRREDGYCDYIILNHVMEHVKEEQKAFSELKRCISSFGSIILTVPICWECETIEDPNVNTDEERLRRYGQKDHVRLYGKDFEKRVRDMGFKVKGYRAANELIADEMTRLNLIPEDTVWILKK